MTVTHSPGMIKKFRRTPWRFQQTMELPKRDELPDFVRAFTASHGCLEEATIILDDIVLGTRRMTALCPSGSPLPLVRESSLTAQVGEELNALLVAVFQDVADFIFIPTPKPFVLYADHDGWITFYANTRSHLNHIVGPLEAQGYRLVEGWERVL